MDLSRAINKIRGRTMDVDVEALAKGEATSFQLESKARAEKSQDRSIEFQPVSDTRV